MRITALSCLTLFALLPGCASRTRCTGVARLELRGADGALELRVVDGARPGALDLCDASGQRTGGLSWEGQALVLSDAGGNERLRVAEAGAMEVAGPQGQALRLFKSGAGLRVLKADGVPYGTFTATEQQVLVSDPGGSPLAKLSARDADAVIAAPDGATRAYVVPSPGLLSAAAFALSDLPVEDRAFLAVQLARPRLGPK